MVPARKLLLLPFVLVLATVGAQTPQPQPILNSGVSSSERAGQIAAIQSQLVELRNVYKESYPDVRKLEIQLQALQYPQNISNPKAPATQRTRAPSTGRASQIAAIQSQLVELRKVYKESYPDVRRVELQLQALQARP